MGFIMVLNDGETFTDLNGCKIVSVPDDFIEDRIDWDRDDIHVVSEFLDYNAKSLIEQLRGELDAAQLAYIAASNPGINMDEVREVRKRQTWANYTEEVNNGGTK